MHYTKNLILVVPLRAGHFHFAKYIDALLQSRILALQGRIPDHITVNTDEKIRNHIVSRDKACLRYVILAVNHYAEALILDIKHVYQALPRLLSLWFDFTSIPAKNKVKSGHPSGITNSPDLECKCPPSPECERYQQCVGYICLTGILFFFLYFF
jgi:hypothetical protein